MNVLLCSYLRTKKLYLWVGVCWFGLVSVIMCQIVEWVYVIVLFGIMTHYSLKEVVHEGEVVHMW